MLTRMTENTGESKQFQH